LEKKATIEHAELVLIAEFIAACLILVILLAWVNNTTTNKSFDKNFIARDVSLLTSTIYSSPGNLLYKYQANEEYMFDFNNYQTKVSFQDDKFPVHYPCRKNDNLLFGNKPLTSEYLYFLNSGNNFKIDLSLEPNLNKLTCKETKTNKIYSLGIDPMEIETISEDLTLKISNSIIQNLRLEIQNIKITRDDGVPRNINELNNVEAIIGIRSNNYNPNKNYLKAYYSSSSKKTQESQKLACLMINKLLEDIKFDGASMISINPKDFDDAEQEKILDNDKIAVILEIGNINNKNILSILKDPKIPTKISNAIREYNQNG